MKILLNSFLLIIISSQLISAQNYQQETDVLQNGMIVLTSMSSANIGLSTYSLIDDSQNNKDFHVTNLAWNGINLGIGIWGLLSAKKDSKEIKTQEELNDHLRKQRNFVLINAGVDLGYIGLGFWRKSKNEQQGKAIIYNGALLCVFDTLFALSINSKIKKENSKIGFHSGENGVGIKIALN